MTVVQNTRIWSQGFTVLCLALCNVHPDFFKKWKKVRRQLNQRPEYWVAILHFVCLTYIGQRMNNSFKNLFLQLMVEYILQNVDNFIMSTEMSIRPNAITPLPPSLLVKMVTFQSGMIRSPCYTKLYVWLGHSTFGWSFYNHRQIRHQISWSDCSNTDVRIRKKNCRRNPRLPWESPCKKLQDEPPRDIACP